MRKLATILLTTALAGSGSAQQPQHLPNQPGGSEVSMNASSDLPIERIGADDLIGITVYDSPELTRTVRADSNGAIRLPMMEQPINAKGLYPSELEKSIASALIEEHVLVDPIVTVNVVEYRSRPISVVGAVRNPITFQATGSCLLYTSPSPRDTR